jgi:hypothetical protein
MSSTAPQLNNQLFQENWNQDVPAQIVGAGTEAKISYLMVEQVTPPNYLWDAIVHRLDAQEAAVQPKMNNKAIIAAMIVGAIAAIASILYCVV